MKKQDNPRQNQQGSALLWVFVVIALFAGLSLLISRGSKTGEITLTKEQEQLAATEIINYGAGIRDAVKMLRTNGCSDTQISFETNPNVQYGNYFNAKSPTDGSCHVYAPGAGGKRYMTIKPEFQTTDPDDYASAAYLGHVFYSGSNTVKGVGSQLDDLLFFAPWLTKSLCMKINDILGIENPNGDAPNNDIDVAVVNPFIGGHYEVNNNQKIEGAGIDGKTAACIKETVNCNNSALPHKCYHYYQTLIAR